MFFYLPTNHSIDSGRYKHEGRELSNARDVFHLVPIQLKVKPEIIYVFLIDLTEFKLHDNLNDHLR